MIGGTTHLDASGMSHDGMPRFSVGFSRATLSRLLRGGRAAGGENKTMIWAWVLAGVATGWLSSLRSAWGLPLVAFAMMTLVAAAARGLSGDVAVALLAFWIAAQGAWFLAKLRATSEGTDAHS